jgi:hypothetical protein
MQENIATIREFLTRAELRITRGTDIYQVILINQDGTATTLKNPISGLHVKGIVLTEEEIASLASLCFPAQEVK